MLAASIPTFWLGLYLIMIFSVTLGGSQVRAFHRLSDEGGISNLRYLLLAQPDLSGPQRRADRAACPRLHAGRFARRSCPHGPRQGLHPSRVAIKHIFRNALISVAAAFGFTFAALISEAVVTETVFSLPGIGRLGRTIDLAPRLSGHPRRDPSNCGSLYGHQPVGRPRLCTR